PKIVGRPPRRTPAFPRGRQQRMKHRQLRLNELVKRELSAIIPREINFDGALVSVNAVDVAPDLKTAHVFVSTLRAETGASVIDKLEAHRSALQTELSRHVVLKYTPHLIFHLDESIKRGARVLEILDDLGKRDGHNE
ncbi:MAG: 30S ribosome-binding factor RbfA, partial [Alphaproteobacteria bacterium]